MGSAEHHFHCYTPGRLILQHARNIGYEIVHVHSDLSGTTWIEIKKPGVLDSIRGAQALASVLRKAPETPKVVDKSLTDLYNELDLDMLIELARVLNVDISQDKTKHDFNIKKVTLKRKRCDHRSKVVNTQAKPFEKHEFKISRGITHTFLNNLLHL